MRRVVVSLLLGVVVVLLVGLVLVAPTANPPRPTTELTPPAEGQGVEATEDLEQGMLDPQAPTAPAGDAPLPLDSVDWQSAPKAVAGPAAAAPPAVGAPAVPAGTFDDIINSSGSPVDMAISGEGFSGAGLRSVGGQALGLGGRAAGKSGDGAIRGRPGHAAEPKPTVATWKRSQLTPNTSRLMVGDKEELKLKGVQVDARIDGFRARVVLDGFYYNDQRRALEGSFQLRLPNGASPYYFAFGAATQQTRDEPRIETYYISTAMLHARGTSPERLFALSSSTPWERPREARVVPKEKAAYAYTETVRRRVDPALVEWAGAGIFQSRVFPLEPGKLHRIVVGYDVDLLPVGDDVEFRLELPEMKVPCVADVSVASPSGTAVKIETDAKFQPSNDGRANFRFDNWNGREIVVRTTPPGPVLLTGSDPQSGPYFATRVRPTLPPTTTTAGSPRAVLLVDTSLSASPEQFTVWLKLLEAILKNNRDSLEEFAVLFFNVEAHWWRDQFTANTAENVKELIEYAHTLSLEGATDMGQALADAAAPAWLGKAGERHDVFLLGDAAATWGEGDPAALGRMLRSGVAGRLYTYTLGLAGSDVQLMATLARESGGAVFSVVGDEEVRAASTAHRTRPWQLVGVAIDGGSDVLVAGRPQTIFPDQNLLLVGRGQPSPASMVTLTLRQGDEEQVVKTRLAAEIASELAPRAYGQVAVDQLEELPGATESERTGSAAANGNQARGGPAAKDLAAITTAFARHFRVTGRTCSLVMLETEEDYRRFGINPEHDQLVVNEWKAEALIERAGDEQAKAAANGKAAFLAWLEKMKTTPGMAFDVPLPLRLAIEKMPPEAFEVRAPRLVCKGRTPEGQPFKYQEQLAARDADYDVIAEEAQRRLGRLGPHDALKALSSLVEQSPGDVVLARDVAFSAMEWELAGHAYYLLRRVATMRPFEPQTYHALARCLEDLGNADLAVAYYEVCLAGTWDQRYRDFRHIVSFDYLRLLRAIAAGQRQTAAADYAAAQLRSLAEQHARHSYDLVVIIGWNTDRSDVDLHVAEPGGEVCNYTHTRTEQGGSITRDVTQGYGPEMYVLPKAAAGQYHVRAHYFANDGNRASARTKVYATIYQHWGTPQEKVLRKTVTLERGQSEHRIASVKVE